jgi:hypothetical protein
MSFNACRLEKIPSRRHADTGRNHYAFSDVQSLVAKAALHDNFPILRPTPRKSVVNSLVTALMGIRFFSRVDNPIDPSYLFL